MELLAVDASQTAFFQIGIALFSFVFLIGALILRDRFLQRKSPKAGAQPLLRVGDRKDWRAGLQKFGLIMASIIGAPVAAGLLPGAMPPVFKAALGAGGLAGLWYLLIHVLLPDRTEPVITKKNSPKS